MVKKTKNVKSDNDINKIDNKYELIAFIFKYRIKELLAVCLAIAIILNLADVNLKEVISGWFN